MDEDIKTKPINFQDLSMLMCLYKDNIELTTALTERMNLVLNHQNEVLQNQKDLCDEMANITKIFRDFSIKMLEKQGSLETVVIDKYNEVKVELIKETSSVRNIIYLVLTGSIGMVVSLITLAVNMSTKLDILNKIASTMGIK
jgi:hypothetical protein